MRRRLGLVCTLILLTGSLLPSVVAPVAAISRTDPLPDANVEALCGPALPGYAQCYALRRTDVTAAAVSPMSTPAGWSPADLASAYNLPGGSAGSGKTVAIVDAYDAPNAEADLAVYRAQYGLPACTTANGCFRKVNQNGGTTYPAYNANWAGEIMLDIDMVSAACPACKILLVEANDSSMTNMGIAVNRAVTMGAVAVSNSYGTPQLSASSTNSWDSSYYRHAGIAITASTGDEGYHAASGYNAVAYPAASQYVVAVGGTSLVQDGSARGWSETAWGNSSNYTGAGSGCSDYSSKPSWQTDSSCANRMQADVSAVADPNTGVAVYFGGWTVYGGTSASSPIIASVYAMAVPPAAGAYPAMYLYQDTADLYDVVGGSNDVWGDCPITYYCTGVAGYDGPTGLGTPNGTIAFGPRVPPGAPTSVIADAGNAEADVAWAVPADSGTSPITSYTVTSSPGGKTCGWASGPLWCTVTGLTNGQAYTFTVTATSAAGTGPASAASNSVTPDTFPGRPTSVFATGGDSQATVTWTGPADNGGSAIVAYTVTSSPGGKTCSWSSGDLECTITGLVPGLTYTFTVTATNSVGEGLPSSPSEAVSVFAPSTYHAISPARVLDSRPTLAGHTNIGLSGKFVAGTVRTFGVAGVTYVGGGSSIAVPANAIAVTGNLTVTGGTAAGLIALGPTMTPTGDTTTLNFSMVTTTSENRANNVTMALGSGGTLSAVFRSSSGGTPTVDLIFDVTGYFIPDNLGATYHPLAPGRVLDTRAGAGHIGLSGKFYSGTVRTVSVAGVTGLGWASALVPSNATAITGNLTVTNATSDGFVSVGPTMVSTPATSTLNTRRSHNTANGITVALSGGKVQAVWRGTSGSSADLILDVTGYFTSDETGLSFYPIPPYEALDSATGFGLSGPFNTGVARTLAVVGVGVPTGASGIAGNLTVVSPSSNGFAFIAPLVSGAPSSSTVNASSGYDAANGLDVSLDDYGNVMLVWVGNVTGSTAHMHLDVNGYWAPSGPATAPGAPRSVTAVAGDTSAIVSWTAPASNGGSTISGYTVTSSPGSKHCTWTSGSLRCTVTGLTNGQAYTFSVIATNGVGDGPASAASNSVTPSEAPPATPSTYHAITPARVLDTRPDGAGHTNAGLSGKFVAGTVRTFGVAGVTYVGGGSSIAVPANAIAVTGNLTVTGGTAAGLIALGPTMTSTGDTTTLNFSMVTTKSESRANNVTMGLDPGGQLSAVFRSSTAGASVDLIFDVTGYFTPDSSGATYHPVAPVRILDTRIGIGLSGRFSNKSVRTLSVAGVGSVPGNATAITGNLTVTNASSDGFVAIGPTMTSTPATSTLNTRKSHNTANGVTVALSGGKVQAVWVGVSGSSADLILDVTGYFTADSSGLSFYAVDPYRALDSSTGVGLTGAFTSNAARTLVVGGAGGSAGVPADADGIAGNLTVVSPASSGYALIAPLISGAPSSSTVNAIAGYDVANGFDVSLDGSGQVMIIWVGNVPGSHAHLQLDINGYWK